MRETLDWPAVSSVPIKSHRLSDNKYRGEKKNHKSHTDLQAQLVSSTGAASATSSTAATKAAAQPARMAQAESILGQVRMALSPRTRTAVLRLDPAELGRLRVELRVDQGKAHAHLIVERPEALAALESHLPELRALFEQQGLEIEGFEVVLAEPGDETPFEDRGAESSARSSQRSWGRSLIFNYNPYLVNACQTDLLSANHFLAASS